VAAKPGSIGAFIELHIEQGPLLEKESLQIGVVSAIAAPASMRIGFEGEGGHAGTVLMPERRDALCGAAELVLAVEAAGRAGSADTVATTGVLRPFPGAINSVPSKCLIEIDVRDVTQTPRDAAVERILTAAAEIGQRRKLNVRAEMINADPPATSAPVLLEAIEEACRHQGRTFRRMPSRAYHDSLFMARLCPTAMIFIPCRGGVSHRPDEYSTPEAVAQGTAVLAEALAKLSYTAAFN
jgi:ureidoglycolate amidohydrolase